MQEAIAALEEDLLGCGGEYEEDPHAHAKLSELLSKHLKAAEREAEAAEKSLASLVQQIQGLQQELALLKRDTAAKAAANLQLQAVLRKRVDGTGQQASFARILKEGKLRDRMEAKAKKAFSQDWMAPNGGACLTDQALFAFLARSRSCWVDLAEEVKEDMPQNPSTSEEAVAMATTDGEECESLL